MTEVMTKILAKEDKPENWTTTSSSNEANLDSLPDLMEVFEKEKTIEKINDHLNEPFTPRNRAERRAWEKELKKKDKNKRVFADNLRQAAERLAYTEMIQRVRKMNEEFEKEGAQENEATN